MASFHPRQGEGNLLRRYDQIGGRDDAPEDKDVDPEAVEAWKTFVRALEEYMPQQDDPQEGELQRSERRRVELLKWRPAFVNFMHAVQSSQRTTAPPRVFISHRQLDKDVAEQIAWQATDAGKDYWLDIHDGTLTLVTQTISAADPRYPFTIAGIIEMALLSCTHVIATHTKNSKGSQWIPYELARAKSRQVISKQAAGWFDGSIQDPKTQGDYVVLAEIWRTKTEIDHWFGAPRPQGVPARKYLGTPDPPPFVF